MKFVKPEEISMRDHPELTEKWVQARIAEDPALLGLGDLVLKDKERAQPRAGRLDLLLQDAESSRRYEVELQLGRSDESHIIRTIEYWDIERKRYPQYEHCAVIVAEDITSRFLNIISLFNGFIPLIAIQMRVFKIGDAVSLVFTKVVDELTLGFDDDDDDEAKAVTDRAYWETMKGTKQTVALADQLLSLIKDFAPGRELKYNKFYIGLSHIEQPDNFVIFRAKKTFISLEPRIKRTDDLDKEIEASGVDAMGYDARWRRYRIRVAPEDVKKHGDFLKRLMRLAYDQQEA